MFEFINEIKKIKDKNFSYRYQNYGGEIMVVQGYKDILLLDNENIVLKLKLGELSIKGIDLCIDEYCSDSMIIKGKIIYVERSGE